MKNNFNPIAWGLQSLLGNIKGGIQNRDKSLSHELIKDILKQRRNEISRDALRNLHSAQGTPSDLVEAILGIENPSMQKTAFKDLQKPKGIIQNLQEYFSPDKGYEIVYDDQQQPAGLKIGKQLVPIDQISPETLQNLIMLDQQNKNNPDNSNYLSKASNLSFGAGSQVAGLPGDIANLGLRGLSSLSGLVANPNQEQEKELWEQRTEGMTPQQLSSLASEGAFNQLASPEQTQESASDIFPTTENIREKTKKVVEGTQAEKYVSPKNKEDKWLQEIGGTAALLTQPGNTVVKTAERAIKGLGAAVGGDLAGWLTKKSTGSETAGNVVKNASYVLYNLFPGLPQKLSSKEYDTFEKTVIKPALEQGKTVDFKKFRPQLDKIERSLKDQFKYGSNIGRQQIEGEIEKIRSFMGPTGTINPAQLWNNSKSMNASKFRKSIDPQVEHYVNQLVDLQKDAVKDFANTFKTGSGKILEKADDLFKTSKDITKSFDVVRKSLGRSALGAGSAIYLMSNFPTVLKFAGVEAGRRFFTRMLQSPAIRSDISQLFKASSSQNTKVINNLMKQLNKDTDKVLKKLPVKEQQEITDFTDKVNNHLVSSH